METKKLRFQDAQIGDDVYCRLNGDGNIHDFSDKNHNVFKVYFPKIGIYEEYYSHGVLELHHIEPILFYRKGSENYLTERPEPKLEVDWSKVEEGTEIEVYYPVDNEWCKKIFYAYTPGKEYPIQTKLTEWFELQLWKKARLING